MLLSSPEGHRIESGPDRGAVCRRVAGSKGALLFGLEGGGDGLVPGELDRLSMQGPLRLYTTSQGARGRARR